MTEVLERGTRVKLNDGVTDTYPEGGEEKTLDYSGRLGTVQRDWEDGSVSVLVDGERNNSLFNRTEFTVVEEV